jgi:hypothetical protein
VTSLLLTADPTAARAPSSAGARVAVYGGALEPPQVALVCEDDPALLIEELFTRSAAAAAVPPLALREIIENLVHAGFADALVSVLDGGRTVRVSDAGPGIADPARAMLPGFSTADAAAREVIRGAGCGLPLAAGLVGAEGGSLDLAANLAGGTVVTLSVPGGPDVPLPDPAPSDVQRRLLALLLEVAPAGTEVLARELVLPVAVCGRELVLLEHRGLVSRSPDGARTLTERGAALLATLF